MGFIESVTNVTCNIIDALIFITVCSDFFLPSRSIYSIAASQFVGYIPQSVHLKADCITAARRRPSQFTMHPKADCVTTAL